MKYSAEHILELCVDVFDVEGIGVSTAKIAKQVKVSNGTLFNYFPTKQDLIDGLYLQLKHGLAAAIGEVDRELSLREQAQIVTGRWFDWATEHPARYRVSNLLHQSGLTSPEAVAEASTALERPAEVLRALDESGLLIDLPIEYFAQLVQSHVELSVRVGLSVEQRNIAFDAMWTSITDPTRHSNPS